MYLLIFGMPIKKRIVIFHTSADRCGWNHPYVLIFLPKCFSLYAFINDINSAIIHHLIIYCEIINDLLPDLAISGKIFKYWNQRIHHLFYIFRRKICFSTLSMRGKNARNLQDIDLKLKYIIFLLRLKFLKFLGKIGECARIQVFAWLAV